MDEHLYQDHRLYNHTVEETCPEAYVSLAVAPVAAMVASRLESSTVFWRVARMDPEGVTEPNTWVWNGRTWVWNGAGSGESRTWVWNGARPEPPGKVSSPWLSGDRLQ